MVTVTLRNVTRNYVIQADDTPTEDRQRPALNDVSLHMAEGEVVSVVGPSGCGKSTLLKIVAGLEHPDQGAVLFNDHDVSRVEPQHRGVGMVFQDYALYPAMKSQGNLQYYFEVHRRTEAEMEQRTRQIAEMMGVDFALLMGQRTETLSGGQQQRVAIARCIVRDPSVFLMDEPISNLDAKLRESTRVEIKKLLRRFRVTTLYVTHDQQEAVFMGDRIAVMRRGRLEQIGSFDDLYYTPANLFVATFIGAPPMAILPGSVQDGGLHIDGMGQLSGPELAEAGIDLAGLPTQVRIGVRPEGWRLETGAALPVRNIERIPTQQASFLSVRVGDATATVLVSLDFPQVSQVRAVPDPAQLYIFAAEDERALHTPALPELF